MRVSLLILATLVTDLAAVNDPIAKPVCDGSKSVSIRYASSSSRLYVEAVNAGDRGGCVTLGEIFTARNGNPPLYAVDPATNQRVTEATGTWLLTEDLYVEDGITLNVSLFVDMEVRHVGTACYGVSSMDPSLIGIIML